MCSIRPAWAHDLSFLGIPIFSSWLQESPSQCKANNDFVVSPGHRDHIMWTLPSRKRAEEWSTAGNLRQKGSDIRKHMASIHCAPYGRGVQIVLTSAIYLSSDLNNVDNTRQSILGVLNIYIY